MTGLRLDLNLPDFLLPEDWGSVPDEQEVGLVQRLKPSDGAQASILSEDTLACFSGLSSSMTTSLEPFPCLADELEQQAKALERDWLSPFHLLKSVPSPRQPRLLANTVPRRSVQLPYSKLPPLVPLKCEPEEQQPSSSNPPATPTKRSQGLNSSWNESNSAHSDPQEVQSPARPLSLLRAQPPAGNFLPPLAMAVDNAGAVRLGRQPVCAAAWRGCLREPWCNREARHRGPCNHRASVPGLMAYSQHQLFESGVNIDELCRAPELVDLGASASEYGSRNTAAVCHLLAGGGAAAKQGKRKAAGRIEEERRQPLPWAAQTNLWDESRVRTEEPSCAVALVADGVPAAQEPLQRKAFNVICPDTLSGHSGHVSSLEEGAGCSSQLGPSIHKRQRKVSYLDEEGETEEEEEELHGEVLSSGRQGSGSAPSYQPSVHALPCIPENGPTRCHRTSAANAAQHPGLMPYHKAGAPRAVSLRNKGLAGNRIVRLAPSTSDTSAATADPPALSGQSVAAAAASGSAYRAGKAAATPAKLAIRQLPKTPDGTTPVVRSGQRRVILHWNSDQVVDPRSGKVVTRVDPATFCTQCSASHTPVWRAGPFGHKTLCNACGVRYMKYSKNKK